MIIGATAQIYTAGIVYPEPTFISSDCNPSKKSYVGEYVVGSSVGLALGLAVGSQLGIAVGSPLGDALGLALGNAVGPAEGIPEGNHVGEVVGELVGLQLCTSQKLAYSQLHRFNKTSKMEPAPQARTLTISPLMHWAYCWQ